MQHLEQSAPLMARLKTVLQMLFSLPGEILDEVIEENNREDAEFLERLQHATCHQQANETAEG